MAVQKNRKTRSRRDMRRSHHDAPLQHVCEDSHTGEMHIRHHMTPRGYYKGRKLKA